MSAADACAIGVGAVCGALSRYQVGRVAADKIAKNEKLQAFAGWHTAGINVAGSFALGAITAFPSSPLSLGDPGIRPAVKTSSLSKPTSLQHRMHLSPRTKLMLGIGFCGSFTTFSTYSVDIMNMIHKGETAKACAYGFTNNAAGVIAAFAGYAIVRKIFRF